MPTQGDSLTSLVKETVDGLGHLMDSLTATRANEGFVTIPWKILRGRPWQSTRVATDSTSRRDAAIRPLPCNA